MCQSRITNPMINKIHERALRIVYKDNTSSFSQLLEKSGSISIHHRNLQILATEICKALNKLSSPLMSELFKLKETKYSFCNGSVLVSSNMKTRTYGINSVTHLTPKICELVPEEIKISKSLNIFKHKIKVLWSPGNCPRTLCKLYVPNLGYVQPSSVLN